MLNRAIQCFFCNMVHTRRKKFHTVMQFSLRAKSMRLHSRMSKAGVSRSQFPYSLSSQFPYSISCNNKARRNNNELNWRDVTSHFWQVFLLKTNLHRNNQILNKLFSLWPWSNKTNPEIPLKTSQTFQAKVIQTHKHKANYRKPD